MASAEKMQNRLYYGDCFNIMKQMPPESIDLIYLDPPFNSSRDYNAIYKDETGRPLPDQIEAFCDTWQLDADRRLALKSLPILMLDNGLDNETIEFWQYWVKALRKSDPKLLAYLSYMVERLIVMKKLLKPTGSIYLHCDPTASHYIKIMMDSIFGSKNYRNEIIWGYRTGGISKSYFPRKHDVLLCYGASPTDRKRTTHNPMKERIFYETNFMGTCEKDANGRWYADVYVRDVWDDERIKAVLNMSSERIGYATQKPLALLERIIQVSSNKGDVVLDPFCGCATTIEAAHKLGRKWVGIDIAIHAIKRVAKLRLERRLGLTENRDFVVEGIPQNIEGARDLWERDKYQFQKWAVEQVDGFVTAKRTADGGIDGRIYFVLPNEEELQSMVLEVKGGKNVSIADLRSLRGVLEREEALMAGLIIMEPLGSNQEKNFREEMANAGHLKALGTDYAKMQMLTIDEILAGKRFKTPSVVGRNEYTPDLLSQS